MASPEPRASLRLLLLVLVLALLPVSLQAQTQAPGLAGPPGPDAGQGTQTELSAEELLALQLRNLVTSWASAWQSQLDEIYLLHYHPDFVADGFGTRADWEASRRQRLLEPGSINIALREFELVQAGASEALVRFRLDYSRPGYADTTWKELQLARNGELWQILRERNLAVERLAAP